MNATRAARHGWQRRGLSILLGRGGDTALRLAIFPATALVLTGSDFSRYALLTAALATGQALLALGAPRIAIYFHRHGERGSLAAWLLILAGTPCAVAALAFVLWPGLREFWFGSIPPALFWVGVAPLPFLLIADSFSATLLASGQERLYVLSLWGRTLSAGAVVATSLLSSDRLAWILWGRLAISAAAVAGLAIITRARLRWNAVSGLAGPALRFGAPLALAGGLAALHRRADVFLLSGLGHAAEIGDYAIAYAIAESLWIVTDSLEAALFVDLTEHPPAQARSIAAAALTRFAQITAVTCAGALVAGEVVLFVLFRSRYPAAPVLLPPLVLGVAAWGAARPASSFLYRAGRGGTMVRCQLAALTTNIALCMSLIPRFGALGAAAASLASYCLLGVTMIVAFRRSRPSTWEAAT
jgi:O-antigen/teichoic acid export membrane protein